MTLQQLEYFRMVAKLENITRSAEKLHVAQPSLSIAIRNLEEELGCQLFDRVGGRILLNNVGRRYLQYVDKLFFYLQEGTRAITDEFNEGAYIINVRCSTFGVGSLLIAEYCDLHRKQRINYFVQSREEIIHDLSLGLADFAICTQELTENDIVCTPLLEERPWVVVAADHPLSSRSYIDSTELSGERFITQRGENAQVGEFSDFSQYFDFVPDEFISTNEFSVAVNLVAQRAGVMIVSFLTTMLLLPNHDSRVRVIPTNCRNTARSINIARMKGHYFPRVVQEFYDYSVN